MSVPTQPKHYAQQTLAPFVDFGREQARAAAGVPVPPPPGPLGGPEPDLSRRRRSTQGKRSIITHVACQPCQRRKHKCDGERPICTPCQARKPSDCVYDAAGDQRRTTALKTRIKDLNKQAEDLREILRGIAAAKDRNAALDIVRQLAAAGFAQAADVADTFRKERAREGRVSRPDEQPSAASGANASIAAAPAASYSCPPSSHQAVHDPGGMPFSPWPLQPQKGPLEFTQSAIENTPTELSRPFWQFDEQTDPLMQPMPQEPEEEIEDMDAVDPALADRGVELRQSEYGNDPATGDALRAYGMAPPGPYWYMNPPGL